MDYIIFFTVLIHEDEEHYATLYHQKNQWEACKMLLNKYKKKGLAIVINRVETIH